MEGGPPLSPDELRREIDRIADLFLLLYGPPSDGRASAGSEPDA